MQTELSSTGGCKWKINWGATCGLVLHNVLSKNTQTETCPWLAAPPKPFPTWNTKLGCWHRGSTGVFWAVTDSSLGVCCPRVTGAQQGWLHSQDRAAALPLLKADPNTAPGEPWCKVLSSSSFQGNQPLRKGQAAISCKVPVNPLQSGVVENHSWPLFRAVSRSFWSFLPTSDNAK